MSDASSNPTSHHNSFRSRVRKRLERVQMALSPSTHTWKWATVALIAATALVWAWGMLAQVTWVAPASSLLLAGLTLLLAMIASGLLLVLVSWLGAIPRLFRWILGVAVILLGTLSAGGSLIGWMLTIGLLVIGASIVGSLVASFAGGGWNRAGWLGRMAKLVLLTVALVALVGGSMWFLGPGTPHAPIPNAALLGGPVVLSNQPDPSQPGPYTVRTMTYGSGRDIHRPEYGADVTIQTDSVDASTLVQGWVGSSTRTDAWGFDATALPINGRVWYPEGDGPFPLILIVHGNVAPDHFSDRGFAYLGELLSSRGFIVASIDENFLNTGLLDRFGGITGANAARGWLLLEHLRVWHTWTAESGNLFENKVDTSALALIGHSRGGEAVAIAAAFNQLNHFPDDATLLFNYHYAIRSVIAIAPSDGQYMPAGEKIALHNINYLTLQGSLDADVISFAGLNQFHRVTFDANGPWIKTALYIDRANHGQFNTVWDRYDVGDGLSAHFINTTALLSAVDQRKVAEVMISAFLESTLHNAAPYRPFLRDVRSGQAWLPDTVYINQYADDATTYISTYEEDIDVTSTTLAGGFQSATNLSHWSEERVALRLGPGDNRAVRLGWDRTTGAEDPMYTLTLPLIELPFASSTLLRFDLADTGLTAPSSSDASDGLVRLSVEVQDGSGTRVRLPIAPLQTSIKGQYLNHAFLHSTPLSEPIFQTYSFPLSDLVATNPDFEPSSITEISFIFNDTPTGMILLDNLGFTDAN